MPARTIMAATIVAVFTPITGASSEQRAEAQHERQHHLAGVHHHRAMRRARRPVRIMRSTVAPLRGWLNNTASCESGGNYQANTGNGFYGGLQFTVTSWAAVGGHGMPHLASRLEQRYRAVLLRRLQGTGAWPVCG